WCASTRSWDPGRSPASRAPGLCSHRSLRLGEIPRVHHRKLRRIDVLAEGRVHLLERQGLDRLVDARIESHGAFELELEAERIGERAVLGSCESPRQQETLLRVGDLLGGEAVGASGRDLLAEALLQAREVLGRIDRERLPGAGLLV